MPGATASTGRDGATEYPRLTGFASIVAQLALVLYVIRFLRIESAAFFQLSLLAVGGFLIHAWLPLRLRLPFFALLSLCGTVLVLGPSAPWVLGIGASLIAVCHLPWRWRWRVTLLVVLGALLAALRAGWADVPWSNAVWPVLGSMFMFRLILYVFELRQTPGLSLPWAAAYFFMLPNVCFPLFPVVDYATFRESHFRADALRTYQRGIFWMVRGLTHLVLYRFLYQNLPLRPEAVDSAPALALYMLGTYLLYLQVSGQFHLIAGSLLLFGFDLPETNHKYLLAASFTEFWRRINIYWKDFMTKVFYFPVYFRARRLGGRLPILVATVVVFLATWQLHAYQWFWLLGDWLVSWQEVLFWSILFAFVSINVLREAARSRQRLAWRRSRSLAAGLVRGLHTLGLLTTISIVWSLWTSDSVAGWLAMWQAAAPGSIGLGLIPAACFLAGWLIERRALARVGARPAERAAPRPEERPLVVSGALTLVVLLGLVVAATPKLIGHLPTGVAARLETLRSRGLNEEDEEQLERGYYERLTGQPWQNPELWVLYARRPADWQRLMETDAWIETNDFLMGDLRPGQRVVFKGCTLTTNRWGMRDRDYEKAKAPGTFRMAWLGGSHTMGSGVCDGEVFESLVEARLAQVASAAGLPRFELLNFAVSGRFALRQLPVLEKVFDFEPDVLILTAHPREGARAVRDLKRMVRAGIEIPYPELRAIVARAGVEPGMAEVVADRLLAPYSGEALSFAYRQIVEACRERGVRPVWLFLPVLHREGTAAERATEVALARDAGFEIIDIEDTYGGRKRAALKVADWDFHPNAAGHRLIAERLYQALAERNHLLPHAPAVLAPTVEEDDHGASR